MILALMKGGSLSEYRVHRRETVRVMRIIPAALGSDCVRAFRILTQSFPSSLANRFDMGSITKPWARFAFETPVFWLNAESGKTTSVHKTRIDV
jgi:hypothetical protein